MLESTGQLEVPAFTEAKNGNGLTNSMEQCYKDKSLNGILAVKIYPDGCDAGNKGHVSIVLEHMFDIYSIWRNLEGKSFQFTLSVVDVDGRSRFPQSFVIDMEERKTKSGTEMFSSIFPIEVERFIRRRDLLDSREEFLPKDTLTVRCELVYHFDIPPIKKEQFWYQINSIIKNESWFLHNKVSDDGDWYLDLRNPDSPLCTRLRQKSELFHNLFQVPSKGNEDDYLRIPSSKYVTFFNMFFYVRFEDVKHIRSSREYYYLYEMTHFYGVPDLHEICREHLKQHLTWDLTLGTLKLADFFQDSELRTVAFKNALSHWKDVRDCDSPIIEDANEMPKMLARELKCAAKVLHLDDGDGDRLCDLAARQVHLNMEILRHSPTWPIFSSEMPDLAKVILSWDSDAENKPAEKYKEHAVSYDFYT